MNNDAIRQFVRRELRAVTLGVATAIGIGGGLPAAIANPIGGTVVSGQGSITSPNAATTLINQQSNQLTLNWSSFNVANGQTVRFVQPSSSSVALNNILSQSPSQIFGEIDANGRVVLINPNGILFGRTAQLNVGSLIASSLELKEYDPATGHLSFESLSGHPGVIDNEGTITAARGGSVALLGGTVLNNGLVVADYGTVAMGAGQVATLDFYGGGLLRLQVSGDVKTNSRGTAAAVENSGTIQANGGEVVLTASAAKGVFASAVDNSGVIRAARIKDVGGVIELLGTDGGASDSGTLDASGADATSTGGTVTVTGNSASLTGTAKVNVSGATGGGSANIGGGPHGADSSIPDASSTSVASGASVDADATQAGNGGNIAVWSDGTTTAQGNFSANGGPAGGNGGMIETSGHVLNATGITVRAGATAGKSGEWLLDPDDVVIDHGTGSSITSGSNGSNTTVFDGDIDAALKGSGTGGTDVTIQTPTGTSGTGAITFGTGVSITNGDTAPHTLTLDAATSINLSAATPPSIMSGTGALTLVLNATTGVTLDGTINVDTLTVGETGPTGPISQTAGSAITVAGTTSLNAGAGNAITLANSTDTFTGALTLTGGSVTLANAATTTTLSGSDSAGSLTLDTAGGIVFGSTGTDSTTVTGALVIQGAGGAGTASGAVSQAGTLAVGGTSTIDAGANGITLANSGNAFTGALTLTGGAVTVANSATTATTLAGTNNAGSLTLDAAGPVAFGTAGADSTTVTGALVVQGLGGSGTASGAVSQVGTLAVGGTSTIDAGANGITLANSGNAFTGALTLTGGAVTLANSATTATTLAGTNNAGSLTLDAAGPVAFGTAGSDSTTVTGALVVQGLGGSGTASGAVSQGGTLTVGGTSTIDAGANGITLANSGNAFTGALTLTGGAVTVANSRATTTLAGTNSVSSLTLDAAGAVVFGNASTDSTTVTNGLIIQGLSGSGTASGAVSQNGKLVVDGTSNIDAGTNGITLVNASNAFTGALTLTGNAVAVANSGAATTLAGTNSAGSLTLDAAGGVAFGNASTDSTTVTGALVIQGVGGSGPAGGAVTQVGKLVVDGTSSINAAGNAITLGNSSNSFGGNVGFTGTAVTLASSGGLRSAGTASGNLSETAGGTISEGGTITVAAGNTATFTVTGGTYDVDLGTASNNFNGDATTITASGGGTVGNVTVADANTTFVPLTLPSTLTTLMLSDPNATIPLPAETLTGTGTALDVSAGGAITQTGALTLTNGVAILNANGGASDIDLALANTFAGNVAFTGDNVTLASSGALSTSGIARGNLSETAGGTISEGAGGIQLSGTAGTNTATFTVSGTTADVDLGNSLNNFNGEATTVTTSNNGEVNDLTVADTNAAFVPLTLTLPGGLYSLTLSDPHAPIAIPQVALGGTLDVTAGGAITQTGTVYVRGSSSLDAGANPVTLANPGNAFLGNVAFNGTAVTLVGLGALSSSGTATGNLNETAGGTISEGGPITLSAGNTATFTMNGGTGDVDLVNPGNNFNDDPTTIATIAGGAVDNVSVADTNTTFVPLTLPATTLTSLTLSDPNAAIAIPGATITGQLAVTANGAITQTGALSVGGISTLDGGANAVTLANTGNNFGGNVAFNGTTITLVSNGGLSSSGTATGTLSETAGGSITQGGALNVAGAATLTADGGAGDITLANTANAFAGPITLDGAAVTLANVDATNLAGTSSAGNLTLDAGGAVVFGIASTDSTTVANDLVVQGLSGSGAAGGAVTQVGSLSVAGNTSIDAGTSAITLSNPADAFVSSVTLTGGAVTLANADATTFAGTSSAGSLTLDSGGAVSESGTLSVSGTSNIDAGSNAITLGNSGNSFGGNVAFTGAAVTLANSGALSSSGTAAGTLTETAGGTITQGGVLNVTGNSTLTSNGGDITLAQANTFGGNVAFNGRNVTLNDGTGGLSSSGAASGTLTETAAGAISQGGALSIAGKSTLTANGGTGDITLANSGNAFAGPVTLAGGTVTLANAGATALAGKDTAASLTLDAGGAVTFGAASTDSTTVTGDLVVQGLTGSGAAAGGAVGEVGTLSVGGTTSIDAGGNAINLNQANAFGGAVSFAGGNVALTAAAGSLTASGTAAGTLTEIAKGPSSDLNVGVLSAGGNVLLIAGDSVLGTSSQATVTANNVEVRYGLENGNGQLGSTNAAQQIEFVAEPGSPRVQLTLWLPAPGTQFQTGDLHQSASDMTITRHPFVAGEQATLYAAPFGVSPGQVAGTLATIQTTLQGTTTQSAGVAQGAATQGTQSVLYIDWGSYNPNVSLFGTLNPAVCLPADQRDESVGSGSGCAAASASVLRTPSPILVAMVPTREGWKPMQLFYLAQ